MRQPTFATAVLAFALMATAAAANPLKSLYTTVQIKACQMVKNHPHGGAWHCKGLPGYPVYIAEGDMRQFVSVGPAPERRRAAKQTLGPFNSIFEPNSDRATIEWRIVRRSGQPIPFATIVRYHITAGGRRDVLVVSKVSERETCHVAYVDARVHEDAIALARQIADEKARSFDCRQQPSQH